jgi:hypothetical protein
MTIAWNLGFGGTLRLMRCRKAATAAEYAIAAALCVTAWGAADTARTDRGAPAANAGECTTEIRRGVSFRWDKDAIEAAPPLCTARKSAA